MIEQPAAQPEDEIIGSLLYVLFLTEDPTHKGTTWHFFLHTGWFADPVYKGDYPEAAAADAAGSPKPKRCGRPDPGPKPCVLWDVPRKRPS